MASGDDEIKVAIFDAGTWNSSICDCHLGGIGTTYMVNVCSFICTFPAITHTLYYHRLVMQFGVLIKAHQIEQPKSTAASLSAILHVKTVAGGRFSMDKPILPRLSTSSRCF